MSVLRISAQAAVLRSHFPGGKITWNRSQVKWRGVLSPSEVSRNYTIELLYRLGDPPDVWVREPNLHALADGRALPHVYDQKAQKLCLFVPGKFWRPDRALAATIIPWTSLWLLYFEFWLVTDVWVGAGEHPSPPDSADAADAEPLPSTRTKNSTLL